jgi:acetyl esterase/lipase
MAAWEDVAYAERDGEPLLARVYRPAVERAGGGRPVVIDLHGGAWNGGDRTHGVLYASHLAAHGYVVVSLDFRQGPRHRHPAASEDLAAAMAWVVSSLDVLSAAHPRHPAASSVSLVGSSSGGHLAMVGACAGSRFASTSLPPVACVAALWPPVDPLGRYRFAAAQLETQTDERLVRLYEALHRAGPAYFGDETTMAAAGVAQLVGSDGAERPPPPAYVARAGRDTNVPAAMIDEVAAAWTDAGGSITVSDFPDQPHAFGHRPGAATDRLLGELTDFLDRHP